jgi:hypothetical protein
VYNWNNNEEVFTALLKGGLNDFLSLPLSKSSQLPWLCMQFLTCFYSLTDFLGPAASAILRKW